MNKQAERRRIAKERQELVILFGRIAGGNRQAKNQAWAIAEKLSQRYAGQSFDELIRAYEQHGYRPTIREDVDPEQGLLGDLYDFFQALLGREAVSYRG